MFIAAGLLLAGAAANAIGLPRKQPETTEKEAAAA
jgi:hypothetical protein